MCDQGWQLDGGEADAGVEFGVAVAHREEQGQDKLQEEKVSLEREVQSLRRRASTVRDGYIEELNKVEREADVLRRRVTQLTNKGSQKNSMTVELQKKVKQADKLRRAMLNTIQANCGGVCQNAAVPALGQVRS
ncbi:hypothetical protein PC119_g9415 [Phytophthora cactorum]|uniref:Uncharacterized protein n=1 Tax=Phytophthora cactorum TaxID=29920 RepID=A0A8T0Z9J2_9STRA|nr:hypothetical protein PC112_g9338 [Phytophthora cactorum]KAG2827228.1 hypothetical protein PC111_g8668 [Phytophthora cactorum]KAG2858513.1 hypothetical protein PC113_g9740 [Phytophthora cactorum]KAG2922964.1 hypothetical protein PC115_g9089 [Phytophthora cactorum]KAG2941848.1 hypothetical protein PC117_g10072 [Phytophthora cactorum]